uniref:Reverse transcriptase domain-containing protein n=1 Tax=Anguilla anguilla TaxID=7936 RepID=A0A0E9W4J3_ANGAN
MPRVDDHLDRLGTARFLTTLDLTKGYWQIPLSSQSMEKTLFPLVWIIPICHTSIRAVWVACYFPVPHGWGAAAGFIHLPDSKFFLIL